MMWIFCNDVRIRSCRLSWANSCRPYCADSSEPRLKASSMTTKRNERERTPARNGSRGSQLYWSSHLASIACFVFVVVIDDQLMEDALRATVLMVHDDAASLSSCSARNAADRPRATFTLESSNSPMTK